jgi:uncharacterized membrane protein
MFDLRLPSGLFFVLIGLVLVGFGLFAPGLRAPMTDANVDLYAGAVMLGFGASLLFLARRGRI